MEDEDGTCLLDVLCDPIALNDFLYGTTELPSGDLLINSSSGEPSLLTDTPSPASLADDDNSQDMPFSGCVDLSFLEEALLASPEGCGGPEEAQEAPTVQSVEPQQKAIFDILQQSLQEADITEHTLALEAGLAQTAETFQFGLSDASLPLPAAPYLSRPLTIPGLVSLPKDTQIAVEPPQPSLLAVGPGCPSLKPTGTQLMNLLPGNVFPTPTTETSFSFNLAQGSRMNIQKTLQNFAGSQMLASTVRTIAPPGAMLQKTPLPIQPKLQVNIQPRLVQISPKPAGQKQLSELTFIPANTSQNVLSPSVHSKQSFPPQGGKPVSLHVVSHGGSIVIQPQGPFQGQRQFFLPSQTPETMTQSTSTPGCPLITPSNQMFNKPSEGHLVDSSHIVTVCPRQINFSPIFTSPTGQLTLKQGALLSRSLPIQSTHHTVFQVPAQLAGTYPSQVQRQHGSVVQSQTVGKQIKLINNASMFIPDMMTIPIINGKPVKQGLPLVPPTQRSVAGVPELKLTLTQSSMLLLHERTTADGGKASEPQESRMLPPTSVEAQSLEIHSQPSPATTLQSSPNLTCAPQPVLSLSPKLITKMEEQQLLEGEQNLLPHNQGLTHHSQQHAHKPSVTHESLEGTLLMQMDNHISPVFVDFSPTRLAASETFSDLFSECEDIPMPVYPGSEHSEILLSPPLGQCSLRTTGTASITGSTTPVSDKQHLDQSVSIALVADPQGEEGPDKCQSPSSSSEELFVSQEQLEQTRVLTELSGTLESTAKEYQQSSESDKELTVHCVTTNSGIISLDQHKLQEIMSRLPSQGIDTYSALQKVVQTPFEGEKEEELTLAKRQHRVKQQLFLDHSAVLNPNTSVPYVSVEDAVRHLLPYHTCARALPSQADIISVDKQFECISVLLFKQITDMLNKYRQLLLAESQQESPSAEMVMLERLFLQSERLLLGEDRRKARRDPESFLMSWHMNSSQHSTVSSVQAGHSSCPSSPPSWALQSDRPPGLRTYRSSSKGALRLTIKHESGSRKVIHNSACDVSHGVSGYKRNYCGQLTNGDMKGKEESIKLPLSNAQDIENGLRSDQLPKVRLNPDMETSWTGNELQNLSDSVARPDYVTPSVDSLLPEQCTPVLKRNKLSDLEVEPSSLPALVKDGELSGHLQSAIDSILELQRLQGSPAEVKPKIQKPHALDQAFSSMLEGQL
ncbi:BRD4-interacting chromatin-remodeling complex-associated protein isoform X2 [Myxocyprinus asiaticus]|uniref:BRD4-interacting chromatin-remodeling complex-associated protein isoform X2 n=1 Tax=Myxocyprinus asiaticus TaxID=70543 RepID=UPI002221BAC9|nr:BRD4-interacting chromatin-remodeling complex-associated protein isoform X2 [Myxocyprinus asiaticus]